MRFEVDGKTYLLDFHREHRKVKAVVGTQEATEPDGKKVTVPLYEEVNSRYYYTTATVVVEDTTGEGDHFPVATYTVGCFKRDQFTPEDGRRAALRLMLKGRTDLSYEFKAALWKAYFEDKVLQRRLNKEHAEKLKLRRALEVYNDTPNTVH